MYNLLFFPGFIWDSPNKLIIRRAYDNYSLTKKFLFAVIVVGDGSNVGYIVYKKKYECFFSTTTKGKKANSYS